MSEELTVIQNYTKEDFNTDKPYKFIYAYKNDKFQFNRISNMVEERALEVKFKRFKIMLKSYVECEEQKLGRIINNATQFDGQPLELATGEWRADEYGITRNNERHGEDIACVHPVMPIERLVNIDTGVEKLKIAYKKGGRWRSEIYDKKTLASTTGILDLANSGIAVNSENAKFLIRYLHDMENLNYDMIPERQSVSRLGWIKDVGFSPYVPNIEFDGTTTFKNMFQAVHTEGNFNTWIDLCIAVRKTDSVARIVLAGAFASVMVSVVKKLNFIVHLWGGTEVGKTVALMLATSVWANPNPGGEDGYIQTFNGTQVAIELQSGFVNSLPLVLDEFQLVKDKKSFEQIVYMICEGIGKMRGAKTGGLQKTSTWRNCTLTSGETPISNDSSGGGAVNRIIELECREKIFENAAHVADVVMANYGHAGREFVTLLNSEDSKEEAKGLYKKFYKELGESSTEKQTMAAAMILTADELATRWIFGDDRALTVEDISQYLQSKEAVDVCRRGYSYLQESIIGNIKKFNGEDSTTQWGTCENGYVNIIKRYYNEICESGGFNPKALNSWMIQKRYTEVSANATDKVVKIAGKATRCIRLKFRDEEPDKDGFIPIGQEKLPFS